MKWAKQSKLLPILAVFTLFSSLFIPLRASAASNSLTLACPGTIETSTTFNCTLSATSSSTIKAIYASFSIAGAQLISFSSSASTWSGALSGAEFSATNTSGQSGTISLGTITLKANASSGTAKISFSNVYYTDATNSEFSAGGVAVNVTVSAPDVIIAPSQNTTPSDTSSDSQAEDKTNDKKTDSTEPSSSTTTQNDTSLKSLSISGYNIDFSSTTFTYNVQIADDVDKLEITAEPTSSSATYKVTNNSELKDGSVVRITVTNGDAQSIYRIKIAKGESETPVITNNTGTNSSSSSSMTTIIIIIVAVVLIGALIAVYFLVIKKKRASVPTSTSITPPPSIPTMQPPVPTVAPVSQPAAPTTTSNPADNPFMNVPSSPIQNTNAPDSVDNPFMNTASEPATPAEGNGTFLSPVEPTPIASEPTSFNFPTPPKAVEQTPSFSETNNTIANNPVNTPTANEPITETISEPAPTTPNPTQPDEGQDPLVVNAAPVPDSISATAPNVPPVQTPISAPATSMPLVNMAPAPQTSASEVPEQPEQPLEPQTNLQSAMPAPERPASEPFSLDNLPFNPSA